MKMTCFNRAEPGPIQDFGPVVGNFDINRIQSNIRHCVTISYFINGINEFQMVRPLKVGDVNDGYNSVLNKKTGATISWFPRLRFEQANLNKFEWIRENLIRSCTHLKFVLLLYHDKVNHMALVFKKLSLS